MTAIDVLAPSTPATLAPSSNPAPVEKAVINGIMDDFDPETFLWIVFHRPDGGARVWYAWTEGGQPLGDRVDQLALGAGLDSADWLHITGRNRRDSTRGRVEIQAHALRPILGDVQAGVRGPEEERDKLRRVICMAAEMTDRPAPTILEPRWPGANPALPRWPGVGPTLLNRPH